IRHSKRKRPSSTTGTRDARGTTLVRRGLAVATFSAAFRPKSQYAAWPANGGIRRILLPQPLKATAGSGRGSEGIAGRVGAASQQRGSLSPHPRVRTLLVIACLLCNSGAWQASARRVAW